MDPCELVRSLTCSTCGKERLVSAVGEDAMVGKLVADDEGVNPGV